MKKAFLNLEICSIIFLLAFTISFSFLPAYASEETAQEPVEQSITVVSVSEISEDEPIEQEISHLSDDLSELDSESHVEFERVIYNILMTVSDYSYNVLVVNAVNKQIRFFSEKGRKAFSKWLSRSGRYIKLMQDILKENNIPEEIVFLPLIESGFNPYAYSPARAVGYWQFMASTARIYDLNIDWWRDERRDFIKSTIAAANYLNDLYGKFGSWNLAIAAYNAGEGKIFRALYRTKTDNYWGLIKTRYIKKETKEYVPKFIAATLIANSPQEFGFEDIEYHPPLNYEVVTVPSPVDLDIIAECAETSVSEIRGLNPELKRWCTPPNVSEYTLRIPEGKKDSFLERFSLIPAEKRFKADIYKVKKGDTLKKIAKKMGIPLQIIRDLNSDKKLSPLKIGTNIYLPPKGKFVLRKDDRMLLSRKTSL
ncbi:MAG: transglycosylase SLT domain-containing protein [Nitrospirota bacterium]